MFYFMIFMGLLLGVSWLLRLMVQEKVSERVRVKKIYMDPLQRPPGDRVKSSDKVDEKLIKKEDEERCETC